MATEANRRIFDLAQEDSSRSGMGTTLTGLLVDGDEVAIVHVGDSRAYVFRDGELRQLTRDHSLVEELRRQGRLTPEEAEEHPQRSIITRALGPERDVELDVHTHQARSGDVYLVCSDGLTSMVREDRLREILAESGSLQEAVDALVAEANEMGGRDNITVVLFRVGGDETAPLPMGPPPTRPWSVCRRRSRSPAPVSSRLPTAAAEPPPPAARPAATRSKPRRRRRALGGCSSRWWCSACWRARRSAPWSRSAASTSWARTTAGW